MRAVSEKRDWGGPAAVPKRLGDPCNCSMTRCDRKNFVRDKLPAFLSRLLELPVGVGTEPLRGQVATVQLRLETLTDNPGHPVPALPLSWCRTLRVEYAPLRSRACPSLAWNGHVRAQFAVSAATSQLWARFEADRLIAEYSRAISRIDMLSMTTTAFTPRVSIGRSRRWG
jgi:hypothetical protein